MWYFMSRDFSNDINNKETRGTHLLWVMNPFLCLMSILFCFTVFPSSLFSRSNISVRTMCDSLFIDIHQQTDISYPALSSLLGISSLLPCWTTFQPLPQHFHLPALAGYPFFIPLSLLHPSLTLPPSLPTSLPWYNQWLVLQGLFNLPPVLFRRFLNINNISVIAPDTFLDLPLLKRL